MVDAFRMATNRTACIMLLVVGLSLLMISGGATAQEAETPDIHERLLDAVRDGDVQGVEELIAAGASLSAPATQYTALHWAAERSQVAVARVLIEAGANVNAKHYLDGTPLHKAAIRGPAELVRLLLAAGGDVTITSTRNGTPLHAAAGSGQAEIATILIQAGAEIDAEPQMTPLMEATKYGHDAAVGVLLAAGANPTPALYWTPTGGIAQRLIDAGADPNARDDKGQSPLHLTHGRFWGPREDAVRVMIEAGGNVNARDQNDWMPLHAAAQQGLPAVAEVLIAAGADINARDRNGNTPFSLAQQRGNEQIVQLLTDAGAEDGLSPFLRAAARGNRAEIARLIGAGEDVDQTGPQRKTALHLAAANDHTEVVLALIAAKANVRVADETMLTPLHLAQNKRVAIALLDAGAELAPKDVAPYATPLFVAATAGRRDVVEVLLNRGGKAVPTGLVQWVAYAGHVSVLELLLSRGADPNERLGADMFDDGETPLIIAARGGIADVSCPEYVTNEIRLKLAQVLIEAGADVNKRAGIGYFDEFTALHGAARLGDSDVVQLLIRNKADVNAAGSGEYFGGLTPLHQAVEGNHLKVVELLIKAGAHVNARTSSSLKGNSTALDLAETEEMRTLLKKSGARAASTENDP